MKKVKYIKFKRKYSDSDVIVMLQEFMLLTSNAGLISIGLHRCIRKFIKELKDIPLSEELQ